MPNKIFSIIIPTFRRQELLTMGLASLFKQKIPWDFEVIVLNENIEDGTKELCQKYPQIRYVRTRPRTLEKDIKWRCPAKAINIGVKLAEAPYLIIACPEIYHFDKNNIKNIIEPLFTNEKLLTYTKGFDDRGSKILRALKYDRSSLPFLTKDLSKLTELHTQYPFFMGISKKEFVVIGGYDEEFMKGYCYDDTDFVNRMLANGCKYLQVSGLICHLYHSRARYNLPEKRALWVINEKRYSEQCGVIKRNVDKVWGVINE